MDIVESNRVKGKMKKNILLVEYSSATIEAIQQILHHKIFDVTVARSEEVARDLLGNFSYDLLITETLLPKSHGYILSKYVSDTYPGTKIIIISEKLKEAHHKQEAVTRHGADDFFNKPLNGNEFKKKILQLLGITEEELQEMDASSDMTTKLHVIPTKAELDAVRDKKNGTSKVEESAIFEINLD